jgi:hypothetical protein
MFRPREKFLILEIGLKGTTGWFLSVDDDRTIIFEKRERHQAIDDFFTLARSPLENLSRRTWEGKHFLPTRRHVVVVASPETATTIPIPLDLARDDEGGSATKRRITAAEVENLAAQAMQKIFNGCRAEAAKRLGIHELDTILVGARATHFRVDGKAVQNPMGFAGKRISLLLTLTFTGREVFRALRPFFNAPEEFFFMEAPQAALDMLARVRKLPLNLVVGGGKESPLFVLQEVQGAHTVLYREKLTWPFDALFQAIMEALAVNERTAKELYEMYRQGGLSDSAARAFRSILDAPMEGLMRAVKEKKLQGVIYLDAPHSPPFDLPHKLPGGVSFEEQPMTELLTELGFSADILDSRAFKKAKHEARRALLYFLAAYFDKSNVAEINRKLRRRLHWLVQA